MKKFVFSVASRATGRLQIKPSGSGDENGRPASFLSSATCALEDDDAEDIDDDDNDDDNNVADDKATDDDDIGNDVGD